MEIFPQISYTSSSDPMSSPEKTQKKKWELSAKKTYKDSGKMVCFFDDHHKLLY